MNGRRILNQDALTRQVVGSLDHVVPSEQLRAIDAAMRQYFDAKDWLGERNKTLLNPIKEFANPIESLV